MSQSPAASDFSDFYGQDGDTDAQGDAVAHNGHALPSSASDGMQMDESPPPSTLQRNVLPAMTKSVSTSTKRKFSPVAAVSDIVQKRQKQNRLMIVPEQYYAPNIPRTAGLPAELWQHVFLYLTPDSLSCCLGVNKAFHIYLTSITASMSARLPPRRNAVKLLDSEAIWTSARKLFAVNLPRPLAGFGEMQMFQLLGGRHCQLCGALPSAPLTPRSPFEAGPGPHGTRIIWSYGTRMCGNCLDTWSLKDTQILQSSAAPLRAGLPHAFRTNDLHYIPATTLQSNPGHAPRGGMFKVYYRQHIEDLQGEYEEAKEFGDAAAEEWIKGLPLNGRQQMVDAARWERWEALHPPGTHPVKILREYFRPLSAVPAHVSENAPAAAPPAPSSSVPASGSSLPLVHSQTMTHPLPARVVAVTQPNATPPPAAQPVAQNGGTQSQQPRPQAPYRPPRNPREVEEARMARKAEIERRCQEDFVPPLMPNVLQHMESFRAALQIVAPLTDQAWEVLKPRLYVQRDAAELIEYQRAEQLRALQATMPDPSYRDAYSKTATEAADRQWEQQQAPIRRQLGKFAEEIIKAKWNNGKGLSRDTAPVFAVEVLLYARNKFVQKHTPADQANRGGPRQPSEPGFVSLENMRWLFDNKVKPITEKHCRELFMCAECEGITKGYAFEGMIQHFGAKHTDDFSQGNIVVHWQTADWPDEPPFIPTVGEADPTIPEKKPVQDGSYNYSAYTKDAIANQFLTQSQAQDLSTNLAPGQLESLYAALTKSQQAGFAGSIPTNTYPGYPLHTQSYPSESQSSSAQAATPGYSQHDSYPPAAAAAAAAASSSSSVAAPGGPSVNLYQAQLNEFAKVAREVWDSTSGIKDLPECIRIQTMLHHMFERFKAHFNTEPTLDLITDALANHVLMRPIKGASPLACKTCVSSSLGSTIFKPYDDRLAENKTYNISSLITHFKTVHLLNQTGSPDWKEDMIEPADDAQFRLLLSASGMDDNKLATIAAAFPDHFPSPLPRIGRSMAGGAIRAGRDFGTSPRRSNGRNKRANTKRGNERSSGLGQDEAEQSDLPEAGEDEYDPRRPAFVNSSAGNGHGRSNPNGRRSLGGNPTPALDPSVLTPDTIAALSKLAPALNLGGIPIPARHERSPSIPRAAMAANTAAYRSNYRASYHPADPAAGHTALAHQQEKETKHKRERPARNRRSAGGPPEPEPEEDYTQIIRTAPVPGGEYTAPRLDTHPGVVPAMPPDQYAERGLPGQGIGQHADNNASPYERAPPVDQYGHPVPVDPYRGGYGERVQYLDEYGRPIAYPPPREEVRYVDQYGRPVEVVRVVERPAYERPPPVYDYPPPEHVYSRPPHESTYAADYARPYQAEGYPPAPAEYARQHAPPYTLQAEDPSRRVQYVDEYGRPIAYPHAPPPVHAGHQQYVYEGDAPPQHGGR